MKRKEKPVLPLTKIGEVMRQEGLAIFLTVLFKDANGNHWTWHAATFLHDMEPLVDSEGWFKESA